LHRHVHSGQPARGCCPGLPGTADWDSLEDRATRIIEDEGRIVSSSKRGCGHNYIRATSTDRPLHCPQGLGVLQTGDGKDEHIETALRKSIGERHHSGGVTGEHGRAIDQKAGEGVRRRQPGDDGFRIFGAALQRPCERTRHDTGWLAGGGCAPDLGRDAAKEPSQIFDTARSKIGFEFIAKSGIDGCIVGEAWVRAIVARKNRELHASRAARRLQAFEAISPVIKTAETAHEYELRLCCGRLHVEVDRERMAQSAEGGEAQCGSTR
jgi:hypothetical protein